MRYLETLEALLGIVVFAGAAGFTCGLARALLRLVIPLSLLLACLANTGCTIALSSTDDGTQRPPTRYVAAVPAEKPVVNIPPSLRVRNYKGGSCVHASTGSGFNWDNLFELQRWWNSTHSGGESWAGLTSKLNRAKIPYYETHTGDVAILERATRERRHSTIFYYPSHSVSFVGFQGDYAYLLDNNRTGSFIEIPRAEFIREWRRYGGVAVVPTIGAPAPPLPYIAQR